MERWVGKVAVVTGASAGIGAAVAEALVRDGMIVVGLARRKERILELADKLKGSSGKLHAIQCDLSKENEILEAFEWVRKNLNGVDVLVNNAGVVRGTNLSDGDVEEWRKTFDVNVIGLCIATKEALRSMKERKVDHGHIININSVAGHRIPDLSPRFLNVYPGSKFAVRAISDTLRKELLHDGRKVKVTNLSPGGVATEIIQTNDIKLSVEEMKLMSKMVVSLQSKDIADAVLYVLGTPAHVQITELTIQHLEENM